MARSFARARKVKEPAAPVVYEVSPEIETVMHRLTRLNPVQFDWTHNFKIGCVIVRGARPKEQGGCVVLARFVKVPPLWHGLTGYDAIIRVEEWAWSRLGAAEQEALVAHELCHGSMSEKGALRVVKHDLEEFGFVVRKYGAWQESIALFDRQLSLFEPGLGTPAAVEGEQTIVPFERRPKTQQKLVAARVAGKRAARLADRVIPAETTAEDASAVDFGEGAPADDDLLPGEVACPWPGCSQADGHLGAHDPTAVDDTPDPEGA